MAAIRTGMVCLQHFLPERVDLARCLLDGDAGPNPPHRAHHMAPRWIFRRHVVLHRSPQLSRGREHVFKILWHDTNHQIAAALNWFVVHAIVESDLAADNRGIAAEAPSPKRIAE